MDEAYQIIVACDVSAAANDKQQAVPLALATPGSTGISGDWHNEIHLNHSGCFKIARAWSEHIEMVLEGKHLIPVPTGRKGRGSSASSS